MGYASRSGRAVTNPQNPRAFGVCDRCGLWYNLHRLGYQYEWQGKNLINTRYRVCKTCLDIANPQLKARIMPQDPVPVSDPRPEWWLIAGFMDRVIGTETIEPVVGTEQPGSLPMEIEP